VSSCNSLRVPLYTAALVALMFVTLNASTKAAEKQVSQPFRSVLREPLPEESLSYKVDSVGIHLKGPVFEYLVDPNTGCITNLEVRRDDEKVIQLSEPVDLILDDYRLSAKQNSGETVLEFKSQHQVILKTTGLLKPQANNSSAIPYTLQSTFFDDGVVVSKVTLQPKQDLVIHRNVSSRLSAKGKFHSYLHKRRDQHGMGSQSGSLPPTGKALPLTTLTSCLEVFSPEAALALFTDSGATHLSKAGLPTAVINITQNDGVTADVVLEQNIINISEGAKPYLMKAGEELTFRTGLSLAPNRVPHPRNSGLRMFTWAGDQKHPYPTHQEILDAARLGFTLFQMHRPGTPGKPRPPAGEMKRVIQQVHDAGMLFIWCTMADMMYESSEGVQQMREQNQWKLWQGFNYGGHYQPHMDPYCNMTATCLSSPNGLAEYRLKTISEMLDKFAVDGIYVDDNLAYPSCPLHQEHQHPHPVYDSLIELHDMSWRRRKLMMEKCPHVVLIDHCTTAMVLPVMSAFDMHLYGEGYGSPSLENYWNFFGITKSLNGQGCLWPGDDENTRTSAAIVYNYDLLTGGGQYSYLDWRLYPKKFPYAKGVADEESLYIRTYSTAQANFGIYESQPYIFAESEKLFSTSTPQTYATIYRNRTWNDYLIPIANMSSQAQTTSLEIHQPEAIKLKQDQNYLVFDVNQHTSKTASGADVSSALSNLEIPGGSLRLLYLRPVSDSHPMHLWGGKRLSESWDAAQKSLRFEIDGPPGLQETIYIANCRQPALKVLVNGQPAAFALDASQGIAFGTVTFTETPLQIEVITETEKGSCLPLEKIKPDQLFLHQHQK